MSSTAMAGENVLQDIKVTAVDNMTNIEIDFGLPLDYVKHFPQTYGEILQIQLQLDKTHEQRIHKEVRQGSDIKTPTGVEPILVYVTYEEGVPGGPYLTLRFDHAVHFDVLAGNSLTSLTVKVHEATRKTATPALPMPGVATAGEVQESEKPASTITKAPNPGDELMAKARQALTFGDNAAAIELLRKVIAIPGTQYAQDARELLGLALERSNQIPRAKFEYKKYLQLYKEGEGPDRVRQRLIALQNIGLEPRKKLRKSSRAASEDRFQTYGRWLQLYSSQYLQRTAKNADDVVQSEDLVLNRIVSSNLSVNGRYRGEDYNLQTVFNGNNTYDLMGNNNLSTFGTVVEDNTRTRVSDLYVDYDNFKHGIKATIGRQRVRNSGIYSRFDGAVGGYSFTPSLSAFAFGGKPVSFYNVDFDKTFYGMRFEYGNRRAPLNNNVYFISQEVSGIPDREAVGLSTRYSDQSTSLFGLVDYDTLFKELTLVNLRWGLKFGESSRISVSYNYRNLLFTSNAVNGQTGNTSTIPELSTLLTNEQLRYMARERTAKTTMATVGYSYQINKDKQLSVDYTTFSVGETKTTDSRLTTFSNGFPNGIDTVEGVPGASNQYSITTQFIASNWFKDHDLHMIGLRYSSYDTYTENVLFINSNLAPINGWRFRPRLSIGERVFQGNNFAQGKRLSLAPAIAADYQWSKKWLFNLELGLEWTRYDDPNFPNEALQDLRIGYNYTF